MTIAEGEVIAAIEQLGWIDDGKTDEYRFAARSDPGSTIRIRGRKRFRLPDSVRRVSVGPQTTNFYELRPKKVTGFRRFETKRQLREIIAYAGRDLR